jgi:hypothetical protein
MSSTRPAAVRWIVALTGVRIVVAVLVIGAALFFISPSDSEMVESFRRGWVGATGHSVEGYGPEQAGEVAGAASVPLILSIVMLAFVRRRKLKALRVTALVSLILSWASPITWPLTLTTVVLASRKSVQDYCEATPMRRTTAVRPGAPRPRAITQP